jgi:hypothetical protein
VGESSDRIKFLVHKKKIKKNRAFNDQSLSDRMKILVQKNKINKIEHLMTGG